MVKLYNNVNVIKGNKFVNILHTILFCFFIILYIYAIHRNINYSPQESNKLTLKTLASILSCYFKGIPYDVKRFRNGVPYWLLLIICLTTCAGAYNNCGSADIVDSSSCNALLPRGPPSHIPCHPSSFIYNARSRYWVRLVVGCCCHLPVRGGCHDGLGWKRRAGAPWQAANKSYNERCGGKGVADSW